MRASVTGSAASVLSSAASEQHLSLPQWRYPSPSRHEPKDAIMVSHSFQRITQCKREHRGSIRQPPSLTGDKAPSAERYRIKINTPRGKAFPYLSPIRFAKKPGLCCHLGQL